MARRVGRRKKKQMTRLAILVECVEQSEFCGECRMIDRRPDQARQCNILFCKYFKVELAPAFNSSVAERCSDCHVAERCAQGESVF